MFYDYAYAFLLDFKERDFIALNGKIYMELINLHLMNLNVFKVTAFTQAKD